MWKTLVNYKKHKTMKKILYALVAVVLLASCNEKKDSQAERCAAALDVIQTRVSVRHFTDEAITDAQIETLLRAAMSAPTAVNKQPWAFVVIDDKDILKTIGEEFPNSRVQNGATLCIAVCGDMSKALEGEAQGYWVEDTSAATENMLLAAHAMGLGALWVGTYPIQDRVERTKQLLNLPEHIIPMCLVTLGHPAEQPEVKDKFKIENIHYNKW